LESITEQIIKAIRENEKDIDNKLHQKIEIRITDGNIQIIRQEIVLLKK